jgi:syntaxin 5
MTFKDVLEIRTQVRYVPSGVGSADPVLQNMKETKDRTEQFVHSTSSAAIQPPPTSRYPFIAARLAANHLADSLLFNQPRNDDPQYNLKDKGKVRAQNSDLLALDLVSAEEGHATGGLQELQFMDNQVCSIFPEHVTSSLREQHDYIQQRSTAIESIESTIAELGSIFGQLAHMVAEQRETVQRIDADTTDIADNISGAQRELLKYYASISSNRWLMIKVFGVIIVMVSQ